MRASDPRRVAILVEALADVADLRDELAKPARQLGDGYNFRGLTLQAGDCAIKVDEADNGYALVLDAETGPGYALVLDAETGLELVGVLDVLIRETLRSLGVTIEKATAS